VYLKRYPGNDSGRTAVDKIDPMELVERMNATGDKPSIEATFFSLEIVNESVSSSRFLFFVSSGVVSMVGG
jgi:hypothetical protein